MFWWWNGGSYSEGWILKIKGLASVDRRETSAVDHHIAGGGDKVAIILLRAGHPQTLVRCKERSLHFVHGGRNLAP